jgi:hypothetical protein
MYEFIESLPYAAAVVPFLLVAVIGYIWLGLRGLF